VPSHISYYSLHVFVRLLVYLLFVYVVGRQVLYLLCCHIRYLIVATAGIRNFKAIYSSGFEENYQSSARNELYEQEC
jgi:hypothetical protein